jgi:hypothetical protein
MIRIDGASSHDTTRVEAERARLDAERARLDAERRADAWVPATNLAKTTNVEYQTDGDDGTTPLGGGALSLFNEGPYADTVGNRMVFMLETVARSDLELWAAASPVPYEVRQGLQARYDEVVAALRAADDYASLAEALGEVEALLSELDAALRTATRADGAERGLAFGGVPAFEAFADPATIARLAAGAGFAPDPAEVSPEYKALVDAEILRVLATAPADFGGLAPSDYVLAHFSADVRAELDAIITDDVLGQTFTVTLDPPGDVSFALVAMDTWALHHYVAHAVDADGAFIGSQFGADVSVGFAEAQMGIGPGASYAAVSQGVPPFTWDPLAHEVRDANGTRIKPNLRFSRDAPALET